MTSPPGNDERRPGGGGESSSSGTPRVIDRLHPHPVRPRVVIGKCDGDRRLMHWFCPCGDQHASNVTSGYVEAPCGWVIRIVLDLSEAGEDA